MFIKIVNKVRPSCNGWQHVTIKQNSQNSKCTLSENKTKKAPKVSKWPKWSNKKHCNTHFGCGFPSTVKNLAESSNSVDFSTFGTGYLQIPQKKSFFGFGTTCWYFGFAISTIQVRCSMLYVLCFSLPLFPK